MKLISVYIPEKDIQRIEDLIEGEKFPNRSEFIRFAVRVTLNNYDYKAMLDRIQSNERLMGELDEEIDNE